MILKCIDSTDMFNKEKHKAFKNIIDHDKMDAQTSHKGNQINPPAMTFQISYNLEMLHACRDVIFSIMGGS